jgi:membrane-associated phospholipid phosphatase
MFFSTSRIIKIVAIFCYLCLAIGLETVYRDVLFNKSLEWEKEWQTNSSKTEESFFKAMTYFGDFHALLPIFVLFFLWLPLNESFLYMNVLFYSLYFDNFMKLIYRNPRPFWIDYSLKKYCEGSFGNSSGHAFVSTATYLAVWDILTNCLFFRKTIIGKILKYFLFILFLAFIFTIVISRIYLGAHAVNQILYGISLGFAVYFIIFHIGIFSKTDGEQFLSLFKNFYFMLIYSIWLFVLLLIAFLMWGFIPNPLISFKGTLLQLCPKLHDSNIFENKSLTSMLGIFVLIGANFGLNLIANFFKRSEYNAVVYSWNKGPILSQVYRILLFIVSVYPIFLFGAVSEHNHFPLVIVFKYSIPYFMIAFNIYGILIICSHFLNLHGDKTVNINYDMINAGKQLQPAGNHQQTNVV